MKHNWGSKSWGCLVLSLVAACGQDAAQQPVDLADASAVRDARERIDDQPALRLPSMRPQVEDPRELVLGRVAPVDARLVSGDPATLWSCVDSNPATRLDDVRSALEFDVVFGRLEQLSELRLAGPARGTLSFVRPSVLSSTRDAGVADARPAAAPPRVVDFTVSAA